MEVEGLCDHDVNVAVGGFSGDFGRDRDGAKVQTEEGQEEGGQTVKLGLRDARRCEAVGFLGECVAAHVDDGDADGRFYSVPDQIDESLLES
jgi:hypothetical protein